MSYSGVDATKYGLFNPPPGPMIWLIVEQIDPKFSKVAVSTTHEVVTYYYFLIISESYSLIFFKRVGDGDDIALAVSWQCS